MNRDEDDHNINKLKLLNWLISASQEISILELGKWLEAQTNGEYILVKNKEKANNVIINETQIPKEGEVGGFIKSNTDTKDLI
jgi:hypothetical protein